MTLMKPFRKICLNEIQSSTKFVKISAFKLQFERKQFTNYHKIKDTSYIKTKYVIILSYFGLLLV